MLDDFAETADAILDELRAALAGVAPSDVAALADGIARCPALFMAGAGRSGLLLRCAAMRFMHMGKTVHLAGDTLTPAIRSGDLLVVASGSGETASLVGMAGKARELGAEVAVVTANPGSRLARLAGVRVVIDAPSPKIAAGAGIASRQPMGSLFEQAMFLLFEAVTMELMRKNGVTSADMFSRHANLE